MATTDTTPTRHDFPNGATLFVREETHAYHPANEKGTPGRRCAGVSTIAKAFPDSPDGLMYWVEKMCMEGVSRLAQNGDGIPHDPYALRGLLERHGLRWPQIRDEAAQRGTDVHVKMLEALARGDEIPDLADLPEEHQGYGQAVFRWWQERKPKPTHVEQNVLSTDHGYAGRFDLRCELDAPMTPYHGTGIVDLKTGKGVYRADHVQQRGYDIAFRECFGERNDWLMLLQVCPDGTYIEHPCAAEESDFMLALDSYNAAKRVDRNMRGAK